MSDNHSYPSSVPDGCSCPLTDRLKSRLLPTGVVAKEHQGYRILLRGRQSTIIMRGLGCQVFNETFDPIRGKYGTQSLTVILLPFVAARAARAPALCGALLGPSAH